MPHLHPGTLLRSVEPCSDRCNTSRLGILASAAAAGEGPTSKTPVARRLSDTAHRTSTRSARIHACILHMVHTEPSLQAASINNFQVLHGQWAHLAPLKGSSIREAFGHFAVMQRCMQVNSSMDNRAIRTSSPGWARAAAHSHPLTCSHSPAPAMVAIPW